MFKRLLHLSFAGLFAILLSGCAGAVIGGVADGGYQADNNNTGSGAVAGDAKITSTINSLYVRDPGVNAMDIRVNTHRGTVTLHGNVPSYTVAQRAITLAHSVAGVHNVVSKLTVVSR